MNKQIGAWGFLAMFFIAQSGSWMAHAGTKEGGNGGDPALLREHFLKAQINDRLKGYLLAYAHSVNPEKAPDPEVRNALKDILSRNFEADITESKYLMKKSCIDDGGSQMSATARKDDLNGNICFNARRLAEQNVTLAELVGLAFHEHAHHFGYEDKDHSIASFVARTSESILSFDDDTTELPKKLKWLPEGLYHLAEGTGPCTAVFHVGERRISPEFSSKGPSWDAEIRWIENFVPGTAAECRWKGKAWNFLCFEDGCHEKHRDGGADTTGETGIHLVPLKPGTFMLYWNPFWTLVFEQ